MGEWEDSIGAPKREQQSHILTYQTGIRPRGSVTAMRIESYLSGLSWWGCALMAFVPAMLIGLAMMPVGRRLDKQADDPDARTRLIGVTASAFAFIVGFTTNTLWSQDVAISESARAVGQSSSEMLQAADEADPSLGTQLRTLLKEFDEKSLRNDDSAGLTEGSSGVRKTLDEIELLTTDSDTSTSDTAAAFEDFHSNYLQYLLDLNAPRVPDLILIVIVLLGMGMSATLASSPRIHHRMTSRWLVGVSVFMIGLYQLPLWVLNSRTLVLASVHRYLSPVDGESHVSRSGLTAELLIMAAAIAAMLLLFVLPGWLWGRKNSPEPDPEEPAHETAEMNHLVQRIVDALENKGSQAPPASADPERSPGAASEAASAKP